MHKIITNAREFGRQLSEQPGFAYCGREIIREISKRTSLSEQDVQAITEHRPSFSFSIHIGRSFCSSVNPALERQAEF